MKKWMLLFALLTILVSSPAVADHVMTNAYDYGKLEIPRWLMGPVWVSFNYEGFDYDVVHVFTDDHHDPYIQVSQNTHPENGNDPDKLRDLYNLITTQWPGTHKYEYSSADNFTHTVRADDICQSFQLETRWEVSRGGETYYAMLDIVGINFYENFDNVQFKIHIKHDLTGWIKDCAPFKIQEGP